MMNSIMGKVPVNVFLIFSYLHNVLFAGLNILPHWIRNIIFKFLFADIGKRVQIDYRTYFRYMKNIEIGDDVSINRGVEMFTSAHLNNKILIQNKVVISPNVKFYGAGHDYGTLYLCDTAGDIIVERNVWIGANALILQGVRIGECSIVSAASVVTKDVPPYTIVAGVPARIMKRREIHD